MIDKIPNKLFFDQVENEIKKGNNVKLVVQGTSMMPFFRSGRDYVILAPVKEPDKRHTSLKRGDIVLFYHHDTIKLHRIMHINGTLLRIKGDANYGRYEKVTASDVIGVVIEGSCMGGHTFKANSKTILTYSKLWINTYLFRHQVVRFFHVIKRILKKINKLFK